MDDHFIKNKNITKCRICGNDLTDKPWQSQWEIDQHYKINICDKCGKKTWVKVDFEGSGHDRWKPNEDEEE